MSRYPTIIEGLRSPYDQVKGLVHFGRMLDKIRLHAQQKLPEEWVSSLGSDCKGSFDDRCCKFLQVDYDDLRTETLKGKKTDEELLEWCFLHGRRPSEEEIEVWSEFMRKRGWRDNATERLHFRLSELGLPPGTVETMFDFIELDEGRLSLDTPH